MSNIIDYIHHYHANGWVTVPVEGGGKRPLLENWQNRTLSDVKIDEDFAEGMNVGVVLGDCSGGLVDIDLDCPEALAIADRYLPATGLMFGRKSNPRSHWVYQVQDCDKSKQFQHEGMIVEYRANGAQTVFPPSIHPSGEQYRFDSEGAPTASTRDELLRAVTELAKVSLAASVWHKGQRHFTALAFAGSLLRAGKTLGEVLYFIQSVCIAAQDEEIADRLNAVEATIANIQSGNPVTGIPTLVDLIGQVAVKKIVGSSGAKESFSGENIIPNTVTNLPAEQFTDSQLSDVFARDYSNQALYCYEDKCWFLWDGKQWVSNKSEKIIRLSEECVKKQIGQYATSASTDDLKRTISCLSTGRFKSVAELARTKMSAEKSQFNADPWLLNCKNGVLDLRTGKLLEHRADLYQSFMANVVFDDKADCPAFKKFITDIMVGKEDMIQYLQRVAGYGLTFGIQSRIGNNVDFVMDRIHAGNIYVNRSMIGATVGVQPFGGEGLSGTGPKAGGPHYLLRFVTERTQSINTAAIGGNLELLSNG